jgi:hypothetical protein
MFKEYMKNMKDDEPETEDEKPDNTVDIPEPSGNGNLDIQRQFQNMLAMFPGGGKGDGNNILNMM